ncbi:MAG: hypothetical protein MJZ77_03140 [Bacteroidales bacterium]|nr:hypothetical protein [Bacteroidales bacterium]
MKSFVAQLKDLFIDVCDENTRYGIGAHAWIYCESTVDVVGVICFGRWIPYVKRLADESQKDERENERWVKVTFKEVEREEMVCGSRRIATDICFVRVVNEEQ